MAFSCRFPIICILAGILQFSWISGFEKPCDMSPATVQMVEKCPRDEDAYRVAALRKNCSAINSTCDNFVYHCMMNVWRNATIEVCAPELYIIGHVCGEYSPFFKSIRSSERSCENFTVSCPYKYKSTEQYLVPGCYELIGKTSQAGIKTDIQGFSAGEVIGIVLVAIALLLICLLVTFIIFVKRKMKNERKTCQQVFSTLPICGQYFTEDGVNKDRSWGDIQESYSSDPLLVSSASDKRDNESLEYGNKIISEKEPSSDTVCIGQKVDDFDDSVVVSEPEQQVAGSSSLELTQMENSTSSMPSETASNQMSCTSMTMQTYTTSDTTCDSSRQAIQANQPPLLLSDELPNPSSTPVQLKPPQQEVLDQPSVPAETKQSVETLNTPLLDSNSPSQMLSHMPQNDLSRLSSTSQTEHQSSTTTPQIQITNSLENEHKEQTFQSTQNQQLETCLSMTQKQLSESTFDDTDSQKSSKFSHLSKQQENHSPFSSLNQQPSLPVSTQSNQPLSFQSPSPHSSSQHPDDKSTNEEKDSTVSKTSDSRSPSPTSKTLCNDAQDGRYAQPESPDAPSEKAFGGPIRVIKLGKSELEQSANTHVKSRDQGSGGAHDKVYKNKMNRDDKGAYQTDLKSKSGELNFDDPVNSLAEDIAPIGRTIPSRFQDQINEQSDQPSLEDFFNKRFDRLEKTFTCTIESLTQEFHRAEERFQLATEELRLALQKIEDLEKRLTENKNEITRLSSLLDDRNSQLNERDRELERKDTEIKQLERQLDQRKRENERMEREKEAQQRKSSELKRENERLEREKNELKAEIEKSGKKNKK